MEQRRIENLVGRAIVFAVLATLTAAACLIPGAVSAADLGEFEAELSSRFRAIELSDGYLFEPLPEHDELPVVEISGGELWIDGAPANAGSLARLGDLEPAVRGLAEREGVEVEPSRRDASESERERTTPERPESTEIREPKVYKDDQVVVGGNLVVEEDEIARDVVVFGGQLTILGRVNGDAAVIGGSADIQGEVNGDVAIIGGAAEVGPTARIRGNVETVGGTVNVADGAVVEGKVNEVSFGAGIRIGRWVEGYAKSAREDADDDTEPYDGGEDEPDIHVSAPHRSGARLAGRIFAFVFLCVVSCLGLLFLRGPIERMADQIRSDPAKSGLVGLVAQILFFPLLLVTLVILVISVIGIPLLVLVPFLLIGFALLVFLGFVAASLEIGRFIRQRFELRLESLFVVLILGLFVIQVWGIAGGLFGTMGRFMGFFAAMFTAFGLLVTYLAVTIGLGSALITRAGTRTPPSLPAFAGGSDTGAGIRGGQDEAPGWDDPVDPRDDAEPRIAGEPPDPARPEDPEV